MIKLPDIHTNRYTIAVFDYPLNGEGAKTITYLTASSGQTFTVCESGYGDNPGLGKVRLTGWGNCFDAITNGTFLRCNDGSTIEVKNFRYIVKGQIDDLLAGELSMMNALLGPHEPNKFVV